MFRWQDMTADIFKLRNPASLANRFEHLDGRIPSRPPNRKWMTASNIFKKNTRPHWNHEITCHEYQKWFNDLWYSWQLQPMRLLDTPYWESLRAFLKWLTPLKIRIIQIPSRPPNKGLEASGWRIGMRIWIKIHIPTFPPNPFKATWPQMMHQKLVTCEGKKIKAWLQTQPVLKIITHLSEHSGTTSKALCQIVGLQKCPQMWCSTILHTFDSDG